MLPLWQVEKITAPRSIGDGRKTSKTWRIWKAQTISGVYLQLKIIHHRHRPLPSVTHQRCKSPQEQVISVTLVQCGVLGIPIGMSYRLSMGLQQGQHPATRMEVRIAAQRITRKTDRPACRLPCTESGLAADAHLRMLAWKIWRQNHATLWTTMTVCPG